MAKKDIGKLSSEELFQLAEKRQMQEHEEQKEAMRAQVAELRAERRQMLARHKRELADVEARISAMTGRGRKGSARKGAQTGISNAVLDILSGVKKADTKKIREKLEANGINTANLGQTLAYLKRTGRIQSVDRGVYAAV